MSRENQRTKWMTTMVNKYGSPEAVSEAMRAASSKSRRNTGGGGFKYLSIHDPERLTKISQEGGRNGRRTKETEV